MTNLLDPSIDVLLKELGMDGLPPEEKQQVAQDLAEHFNEVIMETVVTNLNDYQIKDFRDALKSGNFEAQIERITSQVPGLSAKIQNAVEQEFATIKAAKQSIA